MELFIFLIVTMRNTRQSWHWALGMAPLANRFSENGESRSARLTNDRGSEYRSSLALIVGFHSPSPQRDLALEQQLSDAGHEREIARTQIAQRDHQIVDLRRQLERQSAEMSQMRLAQERLEQQLSTADAGRQNLIQQGRELAQKLNVAHANAQAIQSKLDSLAQQASQDAVRAKALEAKVNDLTRQMHERDAAIDQQQELLAHDRDIRELMGARDLYIAEVYDVARTGVTQKPYGRVFYTKGKSLIFYAYDLDQAGLKNAGTFQAWGRRGPDRQQALSLGMFYIDSAAKKRWVLKFDDPKTLAQIDAVFVTVQSAVLSPPHSPRHFSHLPNRATTNS